MTYVIHCYDKKDGRIIEKITKEDFTDAIKVCTSHKEAKFFKCFCSDDMSYHLEGVLLKNDHIDWVRIE